MPKPIDNRPIHIRTLEGVDVGKCGAREGARFGRPSQSTCATCIQRFRDPGLRERGRLALKAINAMEPR